MPNTPNKMAVYIYYHNLILVPDRAFERAARCAAAYTLATPNSTRTEIIGVTFKQDFLNAWKSILDISTANKYPIWIMEVFTHASYDTDENNNINGLEFADNNGNHTLTRVDIVDLSKLSWMSKTPSSSGSKLVLHGCNTGKTTGRNWCPAQAFKDTQSVTCVYGEAGYAYFSKTYNKYEAISPSDTSIYLQAYRRKRNNSEDAVGPHALGDGKLIPPNKFS
ncbi:MAG: hypothetical protein HQK52_23725 [Oligoflexia bacterium]|nr:hypothetical protein [Oligoflexia bacterium]